MGKKPLAGLIGLVTAGMLVTAGCDCCHKNTRPSGDGSKLPPTFPTKNAKADNAAPGDRLTDKQPLSPPAPDKPPEAPTAPLPIENKLGPQAGLAPPNGAAPMGVQTLKQQEGFDNRLPNADPGRSTPVQMPARPVLSRQNEFQQASRESAGPGLPSEAPGPIPGERLPPLGDASTASPLPPSTPSRPAPTGSAPPSSPMGSVPAPSPPDLSSGPPTSLPGGR